MSCNAHYVIRRAGSRAVSPGLALFSGIGEIALEARERAGRLGRLVEHLIQEDVGSLMDFEEVKAAMKALFANLASSNPKTVIDLGGPSRIFHPYI